MTETDDKTRARWMQTFTGLVADPFAMTPEMVSIADIAHALAMVCRFGGHCNTFYSVAEHSVRVSGLVDTLGCEAAMWGLLHDAAEAYLGDSPKPYKPYTLFQTKPGDEVFTEFAIVEEYVTRVIIQALDLEMPSRAIEGAVKQADLVMLSMELRDFMGPPPQPWLELPEPPADTLHPMEWVPARDAFMERYCELSVRIERLSASRELDREKPATASQKQGTDNDL